MFDPAKSIRILDPIHGLIQFDHQPYQELIEKLINSRLMQRLREVRQLGLAEYVYPGATHSRFSHSLGVTFIAQMMLQRLAGNASFSEREQMQIIVAALLHDIGHGPYSHVFESVEEEGIDHTEIGRKLLLEDDEIQDILSAHDLAEDSEVIADLWSKKHTEQPIISSIISGALDADRLDYLRRDQIMTGSHQGQFDWPWLLDNMVWGEKGLMLNHRALNAAEAFLLVRAHLYQTVYFHRTVRGVEHLLIQLLQRYRKFCLDGTAYRLSSEQDFRRWFSTDPNSRSAEDYIRLNDCAVRRLLVDLTKCDDPELRKYAERLTRRQLLHCKEADQPTFERWWPRLDTPEKCDNFTQETGIRVDHVEFAAYNTQAPILLQGHNKEPIELSEVSPIAKTLTQKTEYLRFYYDDTVDIDKVLIGR